MCAHARKPAPSVYPRQADRCRQGRMQLNTTDEFLHHLSGSDALEGRSDVLKYR